MESSATTPKGPAFPTFTRLRKWFFSWRTARRALLGVGVLVTLTVIFYAEEGWRGKRAWKKYVASLPGRGAEFDWQRFVPPRVPDQENFAMTPFLAPLYDFNPRPLKQGQDYFRDTNGFKRATEFGRELTSERELRKEPSPEAKRLWEDNKRTDLTVAVTLLKYPSNTSPPSVSFASRAEAGAELLKELESRKPVLDELRAASRRPHARFNVTYDDEDKMAILLPHLSVMRSVTRVLCVRASAELAVGDTNAAFEDVNLAFYLVRVFDAEPFVISQLVRIAMVENVHRIIREGLADHQWSDAQLQAFQEQLQKANALADIRHSFECERAAFGVDLFDVLRNKPQYFSIWVGNGSGAGPFRLFPSGWLYLEQLSISQCYDNLMLPGIDPEKRRIYPSTVDANDGKLQEYLHLGSVERILKHRLFASLLVPALSKAMLRAAHSQSSMDQAAITCALERFRLATGHHPTALALLEPQFIKSLPHDIITGQPLKYRLNDDGTYVLYSVGWNEKDDGGVATVKKDSQDKPTEEKQGDWVWPQITDK